MAAIVRVADVDEAIRLANDSDYGLGANIYTNNLRHVMTAMEEIKAGTFWVNDPLTDNEAGPFGGMRQSGIGPRAGRGGPGRLPRAETRAHRLHHGSQVLLVPLRPQEVVTCRWPTHRREKLPLYIDGNFETGADPQRQPVVNPATGERDRPGRPGHRRGDRPGGGRRARRLRPAAPGRRPRRWRAGACCWRWPGACASARRSWPAWRPKTWASRWSNPSSTWPTPPPASSTTAAWPPRSTAT